MVSAGSPAAAAGVVLLLLGAAALGACAPAAEDPEAAADAGYGATEAATDGPAPVNNLEEPCLAAGGLCLLESECPPGQLSATRNLCPAQRDRGVECCYGLSIKERRCSARGGVCRPKQNCRGRSLWDNRAEDCASDETCCILV